MASFLAFLKALPVIANAIKSLASSYERWRVSSIEKHYAEKIKAKAVITKRIEKASTDEERKDLVRRLSNLIHS